jgi:hypothetical protein
MAERWMPVRFAVDRGPVGDRSVAAAVRLPDVVAALEALAESPAEPPDTEFLDMLEVRLRRSHGARSASRRTRDQGWRRLSRPWSSPARLEGPLAPLGVAEHLPS